MTDKKKNLAPGATGSEAQDKSFEINTSIATAFFTTTRPIKTGTPFQALGVAK